MEHMGSYGFEIAACEDDISKQTNLTKLKLSSAQKTHISALYQQIPSVIGAETLASAYTMKLPAGISQADLMQYAKYPGSFGNIYLGENGVAGHAPLYSLQNQALVMGAFSVMSIASGQYYLSEINNNLSAINQKADKILEFLYGDKKAELMSEVRFVNFAYQNFGSIMANDIQRTATVVNIQEARKVAMKDIEFYISDLDSLAKSKKDLSDLDSFVNDAFRIKDCLQLAIQLYCMSNILEVSYSQNTDAAYLKYVEQDIFTYIDKCEKRMLSDFSAVQTKVGNYKGGPLKKVDKTKYEEQISEVVDLLGSGEELIKRKPLQSVLSAYQKESIYCFDKTGEVYLKVA